MKSGMSWYESSCFLTHFDYHPTPKLTPLYGRNLDPEVARDYLRESRPALVYAPALGCFGYAAYDSHIAPCLDGCDGQFIRTWQKVCDEEGVRLGLYIASFETNQLCPVNKYYVIDSEGKVINGLACPNKEWADEFFIPFCLEAIERFNPAALWLDGTRTKPCYCDTCKAKFKNEFGIDLVLPTDVNSRSLINVFNEQSLVNCMRKISSAIKAKYPEILINFANAPEHSYLRDMRGISDYSSSDGANAVDLKRLQFDGAYRSTCGIPADLLVFDQVVMFRDFDLERYATFGFRPRPMNLIMTECASQLAHGNRVCMYFSVEADGVVLREKVNTAANASRFIKSRADYCVGNSSVANVALLASRADNMRFADRYQPGIRRPEAMYHVLSMNHIPTDIIHDITLADRLSQYDLVIVGEVDVLYPETAEMLRRFVESGGNVLVIGSAPKVSLPWEVGPESETLFGLDSTTGADMVKYLDSNGVTWLGSLRTPCREYDVLERVADEQPLLVSMNLGQGNVMWLLTDSVSEYAEKRRGDTIISAEHPYLRKFLGRIVRQALGEHWLLEANAAPGVEFVLNRRGQDLIVHMVNCVPGFEPDRMDSFVDEHPVLADIEFSVHLDRTPESVKNLFEDTGFFWKMDGDKCCIHIDRLRIHEAVLFAGVFE